MASSSSLICKTECQRTYLKSMYMLLGIMFGLENYYIFIYKYILYLFAFIEFTVCSNRPRRGKGKGPIWPQRGELMKNKLGGFTE